MLCMNESMIEWMNECDYVYKHKNDDESKIIMKMMFIFSLPKHLQQPEHV